jgi:hypothetical protein
MESPPDNYETKPDPSIYASIFQTSLSSRDVLGAAKKNEKCIFVAFCVTQAHLKDNIYSLWVDAAVVNRSSTNS